MDRSSPKDTIAAEEPGGNCRYKQQTLNHNTIILISVGLAPDPPTQLNLRVTVTGGEMTVTWQPPLSTTTKFVDGYEMRIINTADGVPFHTQQFKGVLNNRVTLKGAGRGTDKIITTLFPSD